MDLHVNIDHTKCLGTGNCVRSAPGHFELDEDGLSLVRLGPQDVTYDGVARGLPGPEADAIREAAMFCPPEAITVWNAESGEQYFP